MLWVLYRTVVSQSGIIIIITHVNKIPINKQAEQKKREFDWSQQNFCTQILRKEKEVWQGEWRDFRGELGK